MKMKLGIDIDGVIADSQPVIIAELNARFNKQFTLTDFVEFSPQRMYGIDRKQMDRFIMEREGQIIKTARPMPGAIEAIDQLKGDFGIHLISARSPVFLKESIDWLRKHGFYYDGIMHLGQHDKREACGNEAVALFIDDSLKNIQQVTSACRIKAYLFDATYNQGELPALARRIFSWHEALQLIEKDLIKQEVATSF